MNHMNENREDKKSQMCFLQGTQDCFQLTETDRHHGNAEKQNHYDKQFLH